MRFLNFLPLAAALVAAAPAVAPMTKDLVKREPVPCDKGCSSDDKYNYSKDDVEGLLLYDVTFYGTFESYDVSFTTHNPNTLVTTPCKSSTTSSSKDYKPCDRARTAFNVDLAPTEVVTTEIVSVKFRLVWVYAEGALPAVVTKKKGQEASEDEYKDLIYFQVGEVEVNATCTKTTDTHYNVDGPPAPAPAPPEGFTLSSDGMYCNEVGYCYAPDGPPPSPGVDETETYVSCYISGEITVATLYLKQGDWDGKDDDEDADDDDDKKKSTS